MEAPGTVDRSALEKLLKAEKVEIVDTVHYALGFSFLGEAVQRLWVKGQVEGIFEYRRKKIEAIFPPSA